MRQWYSCARAQLSGCNVVGSGHIVQGHSVYTIRRLMNEESQNNIPGRSVCVCVERRCKQVPVNVEIVRHNQQIYIQIQNIQIYKYTNIQIYQLFK